MMTYLHEAFQLLKQYSFSFLICACMICGLNLIQAQSVYVGSGSTFYLDSGTGFSTSGTLIEVADTGNFILENGNDWGSDQEYVEGIVEVKGSGTSKLPLGDNGIYAPVVAEHSNDISAQYVNAAPTAGSNGVGVDAVGVTEYWEMTGSAIITLPWNENSGISELVNNNGGVLNSVTIAGLDAGTWNLVSLSQSSTVSGDLTNGEVTSDLGQAVDLNAFSQFTFAIDSETVLSIDDLVLSKGINLLSNPVPLGESEIIFSSEEQMEDLKVEVFDINGRLIRSYEGVETYNGLGRVSKGNLGRGLYFMKFEDQGKQGVKKIIIE